MTAPPPDDNRLRTGVPGLDRLLGGGLRQGGLHHVFGRMGMGKTVLAHQIASHVLRGGGTALYLTALTEAHHTLIAQSRTFSFHVPGAVPDTLYYASLFPALARGGLRAVSDELARSVTERAPTFLVLDGLDALMRADGNTLEHHRFLHDIEALAALSGVTMVTIARPIPNEADVAGEVLADGVLALRSASVGLRHVRQLRILKLRGSPHLTGWHAAEITGDGFRVHPRLESVVADEGLPPRIPGVEEVTPFGVAGLDEMLGGGVPRGSVTLMPGMAGAGKTLLAAAFLATEPGTEERGLFFGFHETPDRLLAKADGVGIPLRRAVESGRVRIHWQPPTELLADEVAERMLAAVDEHRATRLVIDAMDELRRGVLSPKRELDFLSAFFDLLRSRGVAVLITKDLPRLIGPTTVLPFGVVSPITDVLVHVRTEEQGGRRLRFASVLKARTRRHDEDIRELRIGAGGIVVMARADGATSHPPALAADADASQ